MILNQKSILVLAAMSATIFAAGLIVGTRVLGTPSVAAVGGSSPSNNNDNSANANAADHSSPLLAATSKIAPADVQDLILESARAEREERREKILEEEALRRGDKKAAAHPCHRILGNKSVLAHPRHRILGKKPVAARPCRRIPGKN